MRITKSFSIIWILVIFGASPLFAHNHNKRGLGNTHSPHTEQEVHTSTKDTLLAPSPNRIVKEASIKGMVCAFCVDNIQKVFRKHKEVKDININLDTKLLTLVFEDGQVMDDKKITKLIKSSGYDVVKITVKK